MPVRFVCTSITRALALGACFFGAAVTARAQATLRTAPHTTEAVVVFLPVPGDSAAASRIARSLGDREVVAVYTTDAPAAYRAAQVLHDRFGGSLIPYDRLSRPAAEFGDLLFDNSVGSAARKHLGQAILVVAEADLTLPFLRRARSSRSGDSRVEQEAARGFVIAVDGAGSRSVTRLEF